MAPPLIPFIPLILKDLTFIHEGNKTYFNGLVNFEKMVCHSPPPPGNYFPAYDSQYIADVPTVQSEILA